MLKKVFTLSLSVLLLLFITACSTGGDKESTEGSATSGESGSQATESKGEPVELNMLFWDSNQEPGLIAMADGFMAKNPEFKINVQTIPWAEYWTKLQAASMGGDMPDIVVMHPDEVENYAQGGKLMDLSGMFEKSEITSLSKFPQYVVEDFLVDGKYYGVPKDIGTVALVYNKDLFDKAGLAYPDDSWTWEDTLNAAAKITDKANGVYGLAAPNEGQNYYWNLIWQNGGDLFAEDGKTSTFDSPEVIEAMNYAVSFIKKGYSPTAADFANLKTHEYFKSGKLGMIFAGSWKMNEYLAIEGLNFDVAQLPQGKERAAICSGMAFSVAASSKNPDAAMKFVEYLGSEEAQLIQSKSGVAIPAYENTQGPWIDGFETIDASPFAKVTEYGHVSPGLTTANEATAVINKYMPEIFGLTLPVEEGLKKITKEINALAK
jgi:multiple sugar transport system substrate-binding protein